MPSPTHAGHGPPPRYSPAPAAGMCLSVFALVRKGDRVLVGRASDDPRWAKQWMPGWRLYDEADLAAARVETRFPATYLLEGEAPDKALARLMRGLVGATKFNATLSQAYSATGKSSWYPGHKHWDLAFVYEVTGVTPKPPRGLWSQLGWTRASELKSADFGWNEDLARVVLSG